MLRGSLVSMVYRKAIQLNAKDIDPAASLTLMSADIERIVQGWQTMHEIWANIIEVGVAIYLLDIQLGIACAVPVGVSIVSLVCSVITMLLVVSRQAMWLEAIERRISFTTAMLASMKGIKMCGLKHILLTSLQRLRTSELTISKKFRRLLIWNMTFAYVSQIFVPIITFAVYVAMAPKNGDKSILDTARIYTSLSLFALLTDPLASLVMSSVSFMGSLGSFTRIQDFLSKEVYIDQRKLTLKSPTDSTEFSTPSFNSEKTNIVTKESEVSYSIKDNLREFFHDAVTVRGGYFGWDFAAEPILKSMNIVIAREKFAILVGPVGCGKSTLLKAFLAKRIPYADHIVVLDKRGHIKEQGGFHTLNCSGGYVSSFELPPADWDYKPEMRNSDFLSDASSSPVVVKSEHVIEAEANKKTGDIAIYLYYIKSIGKLGASIFAVFISAFVFCISFPTIWVKWWALSNLKEPGKHFGYYIGIYAMLGVLALCSLIIACWQIIITMVPRSGEYFHWTLLNTVLSAPTTFFSTTDIGVTLNRFSQDLQLIDMELPVVALNTFATFVLGIAQMSLIGVSSPYTAISFPVVITILYFCQKIYLRTSRQLRFMDLESKAPLYSHFSESLCGLLTLRAFGWQRAMEQRNHQLLDRSQRPFYLLFSVQRWLTLVLDLMVAGIATLLIILVVKLRPGLNSASVGVALLNVIMFSQSIKLLVTYWTNLETHIGAIARVKVFSESVKSEDLPTENSSVPKSWPSNGNIEFKDVSASYIENKRVLHNISFSIKTGEKIGICGRTGSGKSSLVLSLFRMIELSSGAITIDGIDISTIPRQEIRSRILGVCQDPFLIKGSARLNADPTGLCSENAIVDALESVQLMSVTQEKGGLDTDIDDIFLSHGQKQLFCLARAMLRPSTILVLDEATSNIDSKTENIMQRVIREKFANHTIITVAHKLDTILDYDKIAMLDAGRLVAFDDPYTLLSIDSAFSRFYASTVAEDQD
ncbi:ABC multidrug transporter, putative [Paecilomyces variotii No. 5]|uniref:ABC multidrug transporter, putative n=1 Tax=Byssochlamys spectabilis (strain No. 5 / NBRC 109023) TaxID=1356009 RepID=V5FWY7_BYSSN|nr:ABC multidrug transporter, putative [Paecilomyces variotii No. 5]